MESNERIIQEYVPGKQITVAHVIAKADAELYQKMASYILEMKQWAS